MATKRNNSIHKVATMWNLFSHSVLVSLTLINLRFKFKLTNIKRKTKRNDIWNTTANGRMVGHITNTMSSRCERDLDNVTLKTIASAIHVRCLRLHDSMSSLLYVENKYETHIHAEREHIKMADISEIRKTHLITLLLCEFGFFIFIFSAPLIDWLEHFFRFSFHFFLFRRFRFCRCSSLHVHTFDGGWFVRPPAPYYAFRCACASTLRTQLSLERSRNRRI